MDVAAYHIEVWAMREWTYWEDLAQAASATRREQFIKMGVLTIVKDKTVYAWPYGFRAYFHGGRLRQHLRKSGILPMRFWRGVRPTYPSEAAI